MKQAILQKLRPIFEAIHSREAVMASRWASAAHRRLMWAQWLLGSNPEFFDHHLDLHYQWTASRNSLWVERGVFGSLALKGGNVLELACGDGFNSKHFYSLRSKTITACDFDPSAIAIANAKMPRQM